MCSTLNRLLLILIFNYCFYFGYSQNSTIENGVIDLRKIIAKNIIANIPEVWIKKSAVVLVNIQLNKKGKLVTNVILYNDSSEVSKCVKKAIDLIDPGTWKKFKKIQYLSIPVFFVYDNGENDFCFNWMDINIIKMKNPYLIGLIIKPIIITFAEPKRIR